VKCRKFKNNIPETVEKFHENGTVSELAGAVQEAAGATKDIATEIRDTAIEVRDSQVAANTAHAVEETATTAGQTVQAVQDIAVKRVHNTVFASWMVILFFSNKSSIAFSKSNRVLAVIFSPINCIFHQSVKLLLQ